MFIGNESLLSNLTCLLHYMIFNPDCVDQLREELDTLDVGTYGHRVWRDPKVLQLPYLVSSLHGKDVCVVVSFADLAGCRMRFVANRRDSARRLGIGSPECRQRRWSMMALSSPRM